MFTQAPIQASLRGILNEIRSAAAQNAFPGVVLSDHDGTGYTNKWGSPVTLAILTNKRLDSITRTLTTARILITQASLLPSWYDCMPDRHAHSSLQTSLCSIAGVVAQAAWSQANGGSLSGMVSQQANCTFIAEMLNCIAVNQSCPRALQYFGSIAPNPGFTGCLHHCHLTQHHQASPCPAMCPPLHPTCSPAITTRPSSRPHWPTLLLRIRTAPCRYPIAPSQMYNVFLSDYHRLTETEPSWQRQLHRGERLRDYSNIQPPCDLTGL